MFFMLPQFLSFFVAQLKLNLLESQVFPIAGSFGLAQIFAMKAVGGTFVLKNRPVGQLYRPWCWKAGTCLGEKKTNYWMLHAAYGVQIVIPWMKIKMFNPTSVAFSIKPWPVGTLTFDDITSKLLYHERSSFPQWIQVELSSWAFRASKLSNVNGPLLKHLGFSVKKWWWFTDVHGLSALNPQRFGMIWGRPSSRSQALRFYDPGSLKVIAQARSLT